MPPAKPLPDWLSRKLLEIPHSKTPHEFLPYLPAEVLLDDNTSIDRVIFYGYNALHREFGNQRQEPLIALERVRDVKPSRSQLAPRFVQMVVPHSEVWGIYCFTLIMDDSKEVYYETGEPVDFLSFPPGYGPTNVVGVRTGRVEFVTFSQARSIWHGSEFSWCLYTESKRQMELYGAGSHGAV